MKVDFEMETPNSCIVCRFHTIDKMERYGGWISRCLIDRDLKMAIKDSLERRHEKCPGIINEGASNDGF